MSRELKILLWSNNIWNFADGMLGPLFAVFAAGIGGDILDISWAWAVYLVVTGAATILIGSVSDRVGQERIMLVGYALNAFFTFMFLTVKDPSDLFIVQAGLGVALALCNPSWYALYSKHAHTTKRHGYLWAIADGQPKIFMGLAILVGGLIVNYYSFTVLFIVMGTVHTLGTIYTARLLLRPRTAEKE